jgi:spore coat polysaccharide biosynthesis protein SpsF
VGGASDIFRVTTESPFTYFEAIPSAWDAHVAKNADVTSIMGLPEGAGFEIIRLEALQRSHAQGDARHRSELCTLYIREHRDAFQVQIIEALPPVHRMDIRLTIDYPEDLVLCRRVYEALKSQAPRIPLEAIVAFLDAHPETAALVKPYVVAERWFA